VNFFRAILVEDNAAARADLRDRLQAHPEIAIVAEADSVPDARALLEGGNYDLVFLDIQLPGGDAFELVPFIKGGARVIFVTAHDEYAVRAFEVNALDYLLKPVSPERLAAALARVERPPSDAEPAMPPGLRLRPDDIVHLRSGAIGRFAPLSEIGAIEAEENYSLVWLVDSSTVLMRRSLKAWEDILPPTHFRRAHRAVIVNVTRLTGYRRDAAKALWLQVQGLARSFPVGRSYWPELKACLPGASAASGE